VALRELGGFSFFQSILYTSEVSGLWAFLTRVHRRNWEGNLILRHRVQGRPKSLRKFGRFPLESNLGDADEGVTVFKAGGGGKPWDVRDALRKHRPNLSLLTWVYLYPWRLRERIRGTTFSLKKKIYSGRDVLEIQRSSTLFFRSMRHTDERKASVSMNR